jgi:hypothetical protein
MGETFGNIVSGVETLCFQPKFGNIRKHSETTFPGGRVAEVLTVNGGEMVAQTSRKVKIARSDGMGGMEGSTRVTSKTVGVVRTV